jgi:hypothetical protein
MDKDNILDVIEDVVEDLEETTDLTVSEDNPNDDREVLRDEKGRFLKGTKPLSPGRPKRLRRLDDYIRKHYGENAEGLLDKLREIALYDPNQMEDKVDPNTGETIKKKKTWHYYTAGHQMEALRLMLAYFLGPPAQNVEINQNVDIRIEKRVADFTKLINENYDRLKLIKGGKNE